MKAGKERLTERQKRFADFYLQTGSVRQAAELAGYSAGYGPEVRRQPAVERYLKARAARLDGGRIANLDEVLEYLTAVMRSEEGEETRRMKAAELLGKHLGLGSEPGAEGLAPVFIVDDISGREGPE